jgi:tRNA (adenine57-N1/adenine58-N1)-methyltransferase
MTIDDSQAGPAATPWFPPRRAAFALDDLVLLITGDQSRYLVRLRTGQELHTHMGIFAHADIVGCTSGETVTSATGHKGLALEPALEDLMRHLKRGSQVIYPKDAAWLVYRMNLRAGSRVIEAGTGSAGLTMALAWSVAPAGMVYTYENREDAYRGARANLERVGLLPHVTMHLRGIDDGFVEEGVDALFLDVREPWEFIAQVRKALRPGGIFAALMPTTNQVSSLLEVMEAQGFADIAVEEILLRPYKPVPDRLRPMDTMTAHTGYLAFGRMLADVSEAGRWLSKSRQRFLARREMEAEYAATAEARELARNPEGKKYPPMPLP